ncbi:MAG TPA: DUF4440 domain-containing protein [Clostridia bacterium]|nr:DUF4440 domain-containing protein [Clostridia bacterium]
MDRTYVETLYRELVNAFNRHDPVALSDCFSEQCEKIELDGSRAKNRAEVLNQAQNLKSNIYKDAQITLDIEWLLPIAAEVAAVTSRFTLTGARNADGTPMQELSGFQFSIVALDEGTPKIKVAHSFLPVPDLQPIQAVA